MKIMMNEEKSTGGLINRIIIREVPGGNLQIDVFADGNQTGQEYTRQELRMIRELITDIALDDYDHMSI